MKLIEALEILKQAPSAQTPALRVFLACGFTPLHLETFLAAHLQLADPARRVQVEHGLYGDLAGNLERARSSHPDAVVVALEWPDLDARLGVRALGGWTHQALPDVLSSVHAQLDRIARALAGLAGVPVAISLPTVPLPPISYSSPRQLSAFEARLRNELGSFAASLASMQHARVVGVQHLDQVSPPGGRLDFRNDLLAGIPYTVAHAGKLAESLAWLVRPPLPRKGLITDLDDTMWLGILGETGVDGIAWGLDQKAQAHGLYQQLLASLASAGTLIAVASKNDPALVAEAFAREDMVLPASSVFPLEIHWGSKSESVARILRAWNVGADAVVFIDDSPMETAEVKAAFPRMECITFPKGDDQAVWQLLQHLRDIFGKPGISEEDALRLSSIRAASAIPRDSAGAPGAGLDEFLRHAAAEITIRAGKKTDPRALELINKTNQFNLNGARMTESDWTAFLQDPCTFLLTAAYRDRYGPLGTIAVVAGRPVSGEFTVEHWVMSCRAFSRRIEHCCLRWLFDRFAAPALSLNFAATPRNGPLQEFLAHFLGHPPAGAVRLSRELFLQRCPPLYHRVQELSAE